MPSLASQEARDAAGLSNPDPLLHVTGSRGKELTESLTPAGRGGTPDEVASAVLYFLKSSSFVTGQLLAVDGGLSQR